MIKQVAKMYYNKGLDAFQQAKLSDAKQALEKSIVYDPTYVEAYNLLGLYYEYIGERKQAKNLWEQSLKVCERDNRAQYYLSKQDESQMLKDESNYNQAVVAMRQGKYKEAERLLSQGNTKEIESLDAMNLLGLSLYGQKKERKALAIWQEVLRRDCQNAKASKYIVEIKQLTFKDYLYRKMRGIR